MKFVAAAVLALLSCFAGAQTKFPMILSGTASPSVISYGQIRQVWKSGTDWSPGVYTVSGVQTGDTIVVLGGWWSQRGTGVLLPPTDNNGRFATGVDFGVPNRFTGQPVETVIYYELNARAGTHVITPPNIGANSDSDGTMYVVLLRGIKTSSAVRATGSFHQANGSRIANVSVSLSGNAVVGDVVLAIGAYDNTTTQVNAHFTDPPANWASRGAQQDAAAEVPSETCSRIATAATDQSVTWTWTDPSVNVVDASIIAFIPN